MKTIITLIVIAVILSFLAGCGPGQPFEYKAETLPDTAPPAPQNYQQLAFGYPAT